MYNKVILIGNTGGDPEIVRSGDKTIAKLSLATSERYKSKSGEKVEKTEWHRLVCFEPLSLIAEKYITKGMTISVEGKLHYSEYEKDGQKRTSTEVIVDGMKMIGKKTEGKTEGKPAGEDLPF
jgi:single-strand DNA-binding protein